MYLKKNHKNVLKEVHTKMYLKKMYLKKKQNKCT